METVGVLDSQIPPCKGAWAWEESQTEHVWSKQRRGGGEDRETFSIPLASLSFPAPPLKPHGSPPHLSPSLTLGTHVLGVKGVVAAAAELVTTLRAVEVHAASPGQRVRELALGTVCEGQVAQGEGSAATPRPSGGSCGPSDYERAKQGGLTDAVFLKVHCQALSLVLRVIGAFPVLEILTAPSSVLLLPLPGGEGAVMEALPRALGCPVGLPEPSAALLVQLLTPRGPSCPPVTEILN